MIRGPRILTLFAIGVGCVVVLSWACMVRGPAQTAPTNGAVTGSSMNAETLEREVREALPVGSPLAAVEDYLNKHSIEFSFQERSKTVFAIARKLQGGTSLVSKSLAFKFHFDDERTLKSIDAEVLYTGP
jgi:hypothetical protein